MSGKGKRIIGLGNALVDVLISVDSDDILSEFSFGRGSMNLVGRGVHALISERTKGRGYKYVSGGSAANTVRGLARLGMTPAYIGKVGSDEAGCFMEEEFSEYGVEPKLMRSGTPTGQCMVLISPDGERTMATFLGAAVEMEDHEIGHDIFAGYDVLHIEGYLVQDHTLIGGAVNKAKEAGLKISLDMASFNVVEENLGFMTELVREYVDILFANEDEARSFAGVEPLEAVGVMASMCEMAIVKLGEKGSLIKSGDELCRIDAVAAEVVDTTGAGDLYATGFLYGLSQGMSLEKCGEIGAVVAAGVIGQVGPAIPLSKWERIREEIGNIRNA